MNNDNPRHYRVSDQIQKDLAVLIRTHVKDPRLSPFVTIEEVRTTTDLTQAKVYFTTLDDKGEEAEAILNKAANFLRKELGKRIRMRSIPSLKFIHDTTAKDGQKMSNLISQAIKSDEQLKGSDDSTESSEH